MMNSEVASGVGDGFFQRLPDFIREQYLDKPKEYRHIPEWRISRARFAGQQARLILLGWRGEMSPTPEPQGPLPEAGIHIVLRGPTPGTEGVYIGLDWIGRDWSEEDDVLIYSWATKLEAYEFCATVRGESDFARWFDSALLLQKQRQGSSLPPLPSTNPWEGIS